MTLAKANWHKSSYSSGGNQANCVEVAFLRGGAAVRDSKAPTSGTLIFNAEIWRHIGEIAR